MPTTGDTMRGPEKSPRYEILTWDTDAQPYPSPLGPLTLLILVAIVALMAGCVVAAVALKGVHS